ncbi:TPA: IS3 family transposase [Bacillus cereus]|nr:MULTISPECIES: IS3 family transposase [Bacillus]MBY0134378.1 IS3 family transposase [Bacillus cereus]MDZ4621119.1 IS3 family transposase [Bacillus cereus]QCC41405.1 IS3 family transposase [Bacillus sp. DU-106]QCC42997.1 IS3 family transposase [Bacillus sp. DU-106]HDR4905863.1 IS3 family transposase [Bacillus cereus]
MTKFNSEQKINAVIRYQNGNESIWDIAKSFGANYEVVRMWVKQFESHGIHAFKKGYTSYSMEYKLDVLNYMNENGTSPNETAVIFNISSPALIRKWRTQLRTKGIDALASKKKGRLSMTKKNPKSIQNQTPAEGSVEELQAELERLRMENAYFKKVECLSSKQRKITKQDKSQVVYELRNDFSVKALLKLAEIPRSTYYYWVKNFNRSDKDRELKNLIQTIYDEHEGRYGYRRIRDELTNQGHKVNHKKVQRIMKELGLKSLVRMKKYRSYKGKVGKIAPNILDRNFIAEKPNEKWVTDITEFKLFGEKLYLSPMLDLFNGEIIAYTIGSKPTYSLVSKMLEKSFQRLTKEDELLIHSDQGWQYQMKKYRHALQEHKITQSMSRKGNCYDNAVIESFFGIMKSEFLYLKDFESIEHFKQEFEKYIDYYNHKRIKAKLKGVSPVQYRIHALTAA